MIIVVSAYCVNWIFAEQKLNTYEKVSYNDLDNIKRAQINNQVNSGIAGFKVFTLLEGGKMISLTLGIQKTPGKITIDKIKANEKKIKIFVSYKKDRKGEKNPSIIFKTAHISDIEIIDKNGRSYTKIDE